MRRIWTPALLALGLAALSHPAGAQDTPGKGSLGGTLGVPLMLADEDLSGGLRPRAMMKLHFQYVMTPLWRLSFRVGFGWTGYSAEEPMPYPMYSSSGGVDSTGVDVLAYLYPFTASAVYTRSVAEGWKIVAGGGVGVYNVKVVNDRIRIFDPVTFERVSLWSPGLTLEAGTEYAIPANRNVSLEGNVTFHKMLHGDEERFPSGFAGPHAFLDVNFGVNVYFRLPGSEPTVTPVLGGQEGETTPPPAPPTTPNTPAEPPKQPDTP